MPDALKRCFVIMPFGQKDDGSGVIIDFDDIFDNLIARAITGHAMREAGGPEFECIRCDRIPRAGLIHAEMISHIFEDEVAVVDLSLLNANVLYELGVRHALRDAVTILICRKGTKPPFNIQGLKYISYDPDDRASFAQTEAEIAAFVVNGLKGEYLDSPVHQLMGEGRLPTAPPRRLDPARPYLFKLKSAPDKRIGILTGDLRHIQEKIDVWVNSENTNMQMARFFDASGSAVVRYLGAGKDDADQVKDDTIADELAKQMQGRSWVPPATVLVTSAGDLSKYGVKKVFHAAAVQGEPGKGYVPIPDVGECIFKALARADSPQFAEDRLQSILFPLMGTGTGRANLRKSIKRLIDAALNYFERTPGGSVSTAYFLALTDQQRDACLTVLGQSAVEPV